MSAPPTSALGLFTPLKIFLLYWSDEANGPNGLHWLTLIHEGPFLATEVASRSQAGTEFPDYDILILRKEGHPDAKGIRTIVNGKWFKSAE